VTKQFFVVCEALGDFTTATELADRELLARIDWLEDGLLDSQRQWIVKDGSGNQLLWKSIKGLAKKHGIVARGHFDNQPGMPDAQAARKAIHYIRHCFDSVDAILLIRDTDDQPNRRKGLEQARSTLTRSPAVVQQPVIVIGVAVVERESWVISGFTPITDDEKQLLAQERQNLGFDPSTRTHDLIACKDNQAKRSPKRVLAVLTNNSEERQRICWAETELSVLKERGGYNGLMAYLAEVEDRLVPLITGNG
jgi:hypothetical protein